MKYSKISFLILFFTILLFSCRNDRIEQEVIDSIDNPSIIQETQVTGIVKDENDDPLQGVEVTINNEKSQTDERGVFLFRKVEISSGGTMVKFEKASYFENFRTVYIPKPKDKLYLEIDMTPMGNAENFSASTGGEVTVKNGGTISFQANSIIQEYNNEKYDGEVHVFAHWYDPSSSDLGVLAPASLIAKDKDGNKKGLYTFGMMAVELRNEFGTPLNLKEGTSATLTFPIPSELLNEAPETIPLWYVDETTGIWREEGTAKKEGAEYVGQVGHFSFWNCDAPFDLVDIEGYLTLTDGTPLANYPVFIKRENLWGAYGYTNNVGYFSGKVPANELLRLQVWHCSVNLVDQEIGPFNVATDLGSYAVELTDFNTIITGTMVGCMGEPLSDAYGILNPNRIIIPALDGSFSSVEVGCGAVTLEAQFFHGATLNESDVFTIDKNAEFNNLGLVSICTDIEEYISFSIDGAPYRVIPDPEIAVINGSGFVLKGNSDLNAFRWNMRVETLDLGTTNPTDVYAYSNLDNENGSNDDGSFSCSEVALNGVDFYLCDDFEVNIVEVNLVDNYIVGTFNGELASRDTATINMLNIANVEGSFRSAITKNFNECSISGQVWFDLNNNGTRDSEEEDMHPSFSSFKLTRLDGELEFGYRYYYTTDGNYSFIGLEPGDYKINSYNYSYELTTYQIGDPNKDNDFQDSNSTGQIVANVTLSDGEDAENIDLGHKSPDKVTCSLNSYYCTPDIVLQYGIGGGVPPYSISLSNGFTDVVIETYNTIEVGTSGIYTFMVEDAIGNTCTSNIDAPDYRNSVGGWVWKDNVAGGGGDGLYDINTDFKLDGVNVYLYQADGILVRTTISGTGGYNGYLFEELAPGDYYIQVDVPAGEELVDMNTSVYNGSSINPATMQSEVFSITECNSYMRKNIGFK